MPSNYLCEGDYVQGDVDGNTVFGVVISDGLKYKGVNRHGVCFGLNSPHSSLLVPETGLIRLDSKARQKEVIELERRQSILQVALRLAEIHEKAAWATVLVEKTDKVVQPKTGVFVVVGIYSGHGTHNPYIAIVSIQSPTTSNDLASKLRDRFPNGFEGIPAKSYKLPGAGHGNLVAYKCVELPREAVNLIDWETRTVE